MFSNPRGQPARAGALSILIFGLLAASALAVAAQKDRDRTPASGLPPQSALHPVLLPPAPPRPAYLVPVVDPVFGSTITRVSDQQAFGTKSLVLRPSQPRAQPWNADGSRLLLGYTNPGFLLDGETFAFRGERLAGAPVGVWSNVDPDLFVTVEGARLLAVSASSGAVRVLHSFSPAGQISLGEGSPSNDDRSLAVLVRTPTGPPSVAVYDLVRNELVATLALSRGADRRLEWAASSQSGRYIVLSWQDDGTSRETGVELYDRSLRYLRQLYPVSEVADLGTDLQGNDVLVTFDSVRGRLDGDQLPIVSVRLSDGAVEEQLRLDWVGTTISCRALQRPGWCYISDTSVDAPRARTGGYDEIYAVKLDGAGAVRRFAHAYQSPGLPSDWDTLAVPSRDGTRVVWASDWRGGPGSPGYAYVASFEGATS